MAGKFLQNAYLDTQIKTATKDQLLLMLFDGALKFANQAKAAINDRNIEVTANNCIKVQNIMAELMSSLDPDLITEELYRNLMSLYAFVHKRMIAANIERKTQHVDDAIEILGRLRSVWDEAIKKVLAENGGKLPELPPKPPKPEDQDEVVGGVATNLSTAAKAPQPARVTAVNIAQLRQSNVGKPQTLGRAAGAAAYQKAVTPAAPGGGKPEDQKFPLPPGAGAVAPAAAAAPAAQSKPTGAVPPAARPANAPAAAPRPAAPPPAQPARPAAPAPAPARPAPAAAPAPAAPASPASPMRPKINLGKK